MYDLVCPGLTKERGLTLFELFAATFHKIKLQANSIMNGGTNNAINNSEKIEGNIFHSEILIPYQHKSQCRIMIKDQYIYIISRKQGGYEKYFYESREKAFDGGGS